MKNSILCVAASLALMIGAGSAYAGQDKKRQGNKGSDSDVRVSDKVNKTGPRAVPEIDATSGTQAITLIFGVLLIGAERLRRRPQRAN